MSPIYTDRKTGRLYIEFQYRGHRHKERLPEGTTKESAKKIEVKIKNDLMFQSHGIETKRSIVTFDSFIDEVFGYEADNWRKTNPARFTRTTQLVKAIRPFLKGKPMRSIKASDIERFKASRVQLLTIHGTPRKPATVEREMAIISSIFTKAVTDDVIDYNPCGRVKRIKFDNIQDKILRREDEARFFANMHSEWARDICKMALYTGLRQNDIMKMTRFQVDFEDESVTLVQSKTTNRLILPLSPLAMVIIRKRVQGRNPLLFASPVTGTEKGSVRHAMLRACKRAKIEPLTIRDLRRTCFTRHAEDGTDSITISRLAGWTSSRMLHRYVRSVDLMRKAVNREPKLKAVK